MVGSFVSGTVPWVHHWYPHSLLDRITGHHLDPEARADRRVHVSVALAVAALVFLACWLSGSPLARLLTLVPAGYVLYRTARAVLTLGRGRRSDAPWLRLAGLSALSLVVLFSVGGTPDDRGVVDTRAAVLANADLAAAGPASIATLSRADVWALDAWYQETAESTGDPAAALRSLTGTPPIPVGATRAVQVQDVRESTALVRFLATDGGLEPATMALVCLNLMPGAASPSECYTPGSLTGQDPLAATGQSMTPLTG